MLLGNKRNEVLICVTQIKFKNMTLREARHKRSDCRAPFIRYVQKRQTYRITKYTSSCLQLGTGNWLKGSYWGDGNVLKPIYGDVCTTC